MGKMSQNLDLNLEQSNLSKLYADLMEERIQFLFWVSLTRTDLWKGMNVPYKQT